MNLTRSNIAYNLNISPHNLEVPYGNGDTIVFVFSSELYKKNFYNKLYENRTEINNSLSKRFHVKVENDVLADLRLYTIIEKRGFLIIHNGKKCECQKNIILDGSKLTVNS